MGHLKANIKIRLNKEEYLPFLPVLSQTNLLHSCDRRRPCPSGHTSMQLDTIAHLYSNWIALTVDNSASTSSYFDLKEPKDFSRQQIFGWKQLWVSSYSFLSSLFHTLHLYPPTDLWLACVYHCFHSHTPFLTHSLPPFLSLSQGQSLFVCVPPRSDCSSEKTPEVDF